MKEQMEKSEMKEQEEARGWKCKKIVWHTVGTQQRPISFPGREQKEALDSRDHRSVETGGREESRESTSNGLAYHRCSINVCSLPWKRTEWPERQRLEETGGRGREDV